MPLMIDLAGNRFGRLVVIDRAKTTGARTIWRCRCDCGVIVPIAAGALRRGATKSCGCLRREMVAAKNATRFTHGKSHTTEYFAWQSIKSRCYYTKDCCYARYGGRGITVCDRWRDDFAAFMADMGPRPEGLTLDRIDNDGNYEPGNCRWATKLEQGSNKHNNRRLTLNGQTKHLAEWARETGLMAYTIANRLTLGWSVHDALTKPLHSH